MTMPVTNILNAFRTGTAPGSDIGTVVLVMKASFDPTSVPQIELFTLPKGAIPLYCYSLGGATGGTNPTVNVGTAGAATAFANGVRGDIFAQGTGTATGVELTANTVVYGKVGSSAATGGTTTVLLEYVMSVGVNPSGTSA